MFHNSTTLHRFSTEAMPIGRERRMPNGILTGAGKKALSVTRTIASYGFRVAYGPVYWLTGGHRSRALLGKALNAGKKGIDTAHGIMHTAEEAAAQTWNTTVRPGITLGWSAVNDAKINLWNVPGKIFRGMIDTPIAFARTPRQLVEGARKSISHMIDAQKNYWTGEFVTGLKMTRDSIREALMTPIRPIASWLAPSVRVGREMLRSKTQYWDALRKAGGEVRDGVRGIMNSKNVGFSNYETKKAEAVGINTKRKEWNKKWADKIRGKASAPAEPAEAST